MTVEIQNKEEANIPQGTAVRTERWLDSLELVLESVLKEKSAESVSLLFDQITARLRESGINIPKAVTTPYINTIPPEEEPPCPGDREI